MTSAYPFVRIFHIQTQLLIRFELIEEANKLLEFKGPVDSNYDDPRWQMKARRRAWEIVEEVGEAVELMWQGGNALEEVADVFHYLIELMIICDFRPRDPSLLESFEHSNIAPDRLQSRDVNWLMFIVQLTRAINQLKNRPHKATQRITKVATFQTAMQDAFDAYVNAVRREGITADMLYEAYDKKAMENYRRIQAGV